MTLKFFLSLMTTAQVPDDRYCYRYDQFSLIDSCDVILCTSLSMNFIICALYYLCTSLSVHATFTPIYHNIFVDTIQGFLTTANGILFSERVSMCETGCRRTSGHVIMSRLLEGVTNICHVTPRVQRAIHWTYTRLTNSKTGEHMWLNICINIITPIYLNMWKVYNKIIIYNW